MISPSIDLSVRKWLKKASRKWNNSLKSLRFIKKNFFCEALFSGKQIAILSDGTVVCSCFDAIKDVPLGDIKQKTMAEIWRGETIMRLRDSFRRGVIPSSLCATCPLLVLKDSQECYKNISDFPRVIFIENDARCNLRCLSCDRTGIVKSREGLKMDLKLFQKIIDDIYSHKEFKKLNFVGHGESFLTDDSYDFIKYAKNKNDSIPIHASTNGLPFDSGGELERLLTSGLDSVEFSIDGSSAESYVKYHRGGDYDRAISNLKRLVVLKEKKGLNKPIIIWKYILFKWNDNDDDIKRAIELSQEIGVDKFRFYLTTSPITGFSRKYLPFRKKYYDRIKDYL